MGLTLGPLSGLLNLWGLGVLCLTGLVFLFEAPFVILGGEDPFCDLLHSQRIGWDTTGDMGRRVVGWAYEGNFA